MKKTIKQKLAMYKTVTGTIDAFTASWSGIPAFADTYNVFKEKVIQLQNFGRQQANALVGVSIAKDAHRAATADQTLRVSAALVAYACLSGNAALKAQAKVYSSAVYSGSRSKTMESIDRILELANEHSAHLGDFGITQNDIDTLQTLRDGLNTLLSAPRQAIIDRKHLTESMDLLVSDLDDLLKNAIDKLMVVLRESDEVFFNKYSNARTVVHFATSHNLQKQTNPEPDDGSEPPNPVLD